MSLVLYHNPRCSKSRQGKLILEEHKVKFETKLYLINPLSELELKEIIENFLDDPVLLVRTKEKLFKDLNIKIESLSNKNEVIKLIQKYPRLMERPLLTSPEKTIIGRPPENFFEFI
ncbi:MAG: arsenate reductase (glutaredoxin) [Euryarchaeota archaeon]|nr:arsenate reductase (glutaredoxin) [Euryarchaeota archaeon]|tara:strand:- start:686 stop:1036 length:351 start_codon:yes stop_codon:yes gene_type:complete